MYGTKNIVRAIFVFMPTIPKSFGRPMIKALDMLTLEV